MVMMPREHGAWGMLFTSYLIGWGAGWIGAGGTHPAWGLAVLPAAFFAFLAQEPLLVWVRGRLRKKGGDAQVEQAPRWLVLWGGLLVLTGAPLVWPLGMTGLLWLAAAGALLSGVHVAAAAWAGDRSHLNEGMGAVALPLAAPAAWYATTGALDARAFVLWGLAAVYFVGPVFYVKMRVEGMRRKGRPVPLPERLRLGAPSLAWSAGSLAVAALAGRASLAPAWCAVAFVPSLGKVLNGMRRLESPPPIRKIGWLEAVHSVVFAALLVAVGRIG